MAAISRTYPAPAWALARRAAAKAPAPATRPADTDGASLPATVALGRRLAQEHIRQRYGGLTGSPTGYGYGSDRSGNSAELHRLYEEMAFRESVVKAALLRNLDSVSSQTLQVIPADKKSPADRTIADAWKEALEKAPGGLGHGPTGLPAIVAELVLPARVHGLNLVEMPLTDRPLSTGKLKGKLGVKKFAARRPGTYQLRYDEFGAIDGVRPVQAGKGGGREYLDPGEFIIFPYLALYGTTHSELWAAQRGYDSKDAAYKLRLFYLDKLAGGAMWVNGVAADRVELMKAALAEMRSCGFIVLDRGEELHQIDIATGSQSEFDAFMAYDDRDMLIAADGGHLHVSEGKSSNVAGNSQVQSKGGPELKDWQISGAVGSLLTRACPRWLGANYRGADCPTTKLGDIDPNVTKAEADLALVIQKLGYELDPEQIEERLGGWKVMGKAAPPPSPSGGPGHPPGQPGGPDAQGGGAPGQGGQPGGTAGAADGGGWAWEEVPAGGAAQ